MLMYRNDTSLASVRDSILTGSVLVVLINKQQFGESKHLNKTISSL